MYVTRIMEIRSDDTYLFTISRPPAGERVLPEKLGAGVRQASQNSQFIKDQIMRFSLPFVFDLTL